MTKLQLTGLIGLLVLADCGPPLVEREAAECEKLGVHRGDPDFWTCMQMVDAQHGRRQAGSAAMLGAGAGLLQPAPSANVYVH